MKKVLIKQKEGFFQVKNKPNLAYLQKFYSQKYYQLGLGSYEKKYDKDEKNWIFKKNKFREKTVAAHLPKILRRQKTFLDVGCGEGFALEVFRKSGWNVKGIDFSSAGIKKQNPHLRKKVIIGDIEENLLILKKNKEKFSCIMLCNVLEHVINPKGLLRLLKDLLEKKGIIIVTVPNDFSATQKLALKAGFIKKKFWISLPEHLSYFNSNSLKRLFHKAGWKELDTYTDFPVDWFLFHEGSNYIKKKNAGKAVHRAQIKIESEILNQPFNKSLNLFKALAKICMGRNVTGIFQNYN